VNSEQNRPLDLRHILGVLRNKAWIIVLIVAVASSAAYVMAKRTPNMYYAASQVKITNSNTGNVFFNQQAGADISRQVATETAILNSHDLRMTVEQRLGDRASLIAGVGVSALPDTDVLQVSVTSTSPELARDAANTFADVYVENRKANAVQELVQNSEGLRAKAEELNQKIADIDAEIAANPGPATDSLRLQRITITSQRDNFNARATEFEVQAALLSGNVQIVDRAQLPNGPIAPKPRRDAQVAGVVGLLFGIGLVLLLDLLDDRITSPDELETVTNGLPLLGSIPIYRPRKKRGARKLPHGPRTLVPLQSMDAEVYRTVRTNLRFSNLGKAKSVILITSSSGSEGKSTVTANLAVALAESGQRVVVVSGDLRRPVLSSIFGVDETVSGLTSVLVGEATVTDCLVPITLESGHKLYVLPSGPLPPNPAELLGSRAMGDLLSGLSRADVDFVLIDCPPVLPVSDPLAIAQFADGVILLSVMGQTRAHHLREAVTRLDHVGADVIGVILNGVPTASGRYPYHYYRRSNYDSYAADVTEKPDRHATKKTTGRHAKNGDKRGTVPVGGTSEATTTNDG